MISLSSDITAVPYIGPKQAQKLENLHIYKVIDMLMHFPKKYLDSSEISTIQEFESMERGAISATVEKVSSAYTRSRKVITKAKLVDETGSIELAWFNQPYIEKALWKGREYMFELRRSKKSGNLYCTNFERADEKKESLHLGRISPQYPQTKGVSSKWLRSRIRYILDNLDSLNIPDLTTKLQSNPNSIDLNRALELIHFPEQQKDVKLAVHRLQLEEVITLQLEIERKRILNRMNDAIPTKTEPKTFQDFFEAITFDLTEDQLSAINALSSDISEDSPMHRLLNGDVGSGKTVIAIAGAYFSSISGHSTIVLAPTTILAKQHFNTFSEILSKLDVKVSLVTSNEDTYDTEVEDQVIIGTHALLYRDDLPQNTLMVIVDEQHRFGVEQRRMIHEDITKDHQPHYLMMTATPIPRTLTTALFGDMDVSFINTMPTGRKETESYFVPSKKRDGCYSWVSEHIQNTKEQAYIVFPLIEEDLDGSRRSAKKSFKDLSETIFKGLKTDLIHGKLKEDKKNSIMEAFIDGKTDILFSTTVIEVGVDNPNATVMVVEGAESFGLAQLHQLRGRVGRSEKQAYCYLIPSEDATSEEQKARLEYFATHSSGFKIAEFDLKSRGPGEVFGKEQSGIPDLLIADLFDTKTIQEAKDIVGLLMKTPNGPKYKSLFKERLLYIDET